VEGISRKDPPHRHTHVDSHASQILFIVLYCRVIVATLATVTKAIKTAIKPEPINSAIILSAYVRCLMQPKRFPLVELNFVSCIFINIYWFFT